MRAGHVPTTEIGPVVGELLHKQGYTYMGFAEAVDCDEAIIRRLASGQYGSARFDFIDRIFCELSAVQLWWGEFAHLYPVKFRQTCNSPFCNKTFPEKVVRRGVKLYCSRKCMNQHWKIREGHCTGGRLRDECPRGHKFTLESTGYRSTGKRLCLICNRERRRKKMQNPEFREKQRAYERKHRAKKAKAA